MHYVVVGLLCNRKRTRLALRKRLQIVVAIELGLDNFQMGFELRGPVG
jgi:septum formation topological specificity factor MinE